MTDVGQHVIVVSSANPGGEVDIYYNYGEFQKRVPEVPTTFANETDGTWLLADWDRDGIPDLVFIKTNNTPNGHVEVHIASGSQNG